MDTPTIWINETGDMSVGVMPSTLASLELKKEFADALIDDGTLETFKEKLTKLVCEFYEPEYYTETVDNIIKYNEP